MNVAHLLRVLIIIATYLPTYLSPTYMQCTLNACSTYRTHTFTPHALYVHATCLYTFTRTTLHLPLHTFTHTHTPTHTHTYIRTLYTCLSTRVYSLVPPPPSVFFLFYIYHFWILPIRLVRTFLTSGHLCISFFTSITVFLYKRTTNF
jgi:hypothetical protein